MNCQQIGEQLGAFMDGELGAEATKAVSGHLEVCGQCRAELDGLREVKRLGAFLSEPPVVRADEWSPHWSAIKARLSNGRAPGGILDRSRRGLAFTAALAAAGLGAISFLVVPPLFDRPALDPSPEPTCADATPPTDEPLLAGDGDIVVLYPGAVAPVPVVLVSGRR